MIVRNVKGGAGNEAWKQALAQATSGEEFAKSRDAVMKMVNDAKKPSSKTMTTKQKAEQFIRDVMEVIDDAANDKIPSDDAMSWLYNELDNFKTVLACL